MSLGRSQHRNADINRRREAGISRRHSAGPKRRHQADISLHRSESISRPRSERSPGHIRLLHKAIILANGSTAIASSRSISNSVRYKAILAFAACPSNGRSNSSNGCSISILCLRTVSNRSFTGWKHGNT
jgi:hypothetical protein